jgi:hypothetical protein
VNSDSAWNYLIYMKIYMRVNQAASVRHKVQIVKIKYELQKHGQGVRRKFQTSHSQTRRKQNLDLDKTSLTRQFVGALEKYVYH